MINNKPFSVSSIRLMTDIICHRGPDDEGFVLFPGPGSEPIIAGGPSTPSDVLGSALSFSPGRMINIFDETYVSVAFGHRRLAILDLSPGGHMPMCYDNMRFWITYNGEIYNHAEIRAELEKDGYIFQTRSDTEVILASYARWGEKCQEKFVGMWAIAIYDKLTDEIFISRDRFGIKPFYYWFSPDGSFCFGSEIKQFTVLPGWKAVLNPAMAYDHLVYSLADHTDETFFKGVFHLQGGTCFRSLTRKISCNKEGRLIGQVKWYHPLKQPYRGTFNDASITFRKLFKNSISEHLRADVPVGSALSGGLDSTAIVCEVHRLLRTKNKGYLQKTFSSCSTDERFDERKWINLVVDQTKSSAFFTYPQIEDVISMTSDIVWHQDEPYQSQSAFLAYNVFHLAREHGVKVLLNGQGADEYLGGYSQFTIPRYASMLKQLKFRDVIRDFKKSQAIKPESMFSLLKKLNYHFMPTTLKRQFADISSRYSHIKNIIDISKLGIQPVHPYDRIPMGQRDVMEMTEHLTFFSTLPKYLHWEDRNSMSCSIEARVPFLDHRLFEFAFNLPDEFLEKDGRTKVILRESLSGLIPDKIRDRKDKMGFITPEERWVKQDNSTLFRDMLSNSIDTTCGIIKPEAVSYYNKVVSEQLPFDYTYWRLILFGEWVKKFGVSLNG